MKNRNSYLINKSLKNFMVASIATMAIMNINGIVDSIIMGHLIGPEAVSAIQNVVPVIGLLSGISFLFSAGASIITAKALGRRDFDEAGSSVLPWGWPYHILPLRSACAESQFTALSGQGIIR